MQQRWITLYILAGAVLIFISQSSQAGLSGRLDTLVSLDNREFHNRGRVEERLDVNYESLASNLRSGLSLGLRQQEGEYDSQIYQLYLEKKFSSKGSALLLGRFQNTDTLGFYSLDGVRLNLNSAATTLNLYAGVPQRLEEFQAIEGDALYGADFFVRGQNWLGLTLDGRIGWQTLKQDIKTADRLNFGLRGRWQQKSDVLRVKNSALANPFSFSLAGTYLADEEHWEAFQVNMQTKVFNNSHLRFDYETYEPGVEVPTFKDRFYSLYGRERQTQFKAGYQFNSGHKTSWSLSGRRVFKDVGDNGYGGAFGWRHNNNRGLQMEAQLDYLAVSNDRTASLYFETRKVLTSEMRAVMGTVLQGYKKRLSGSNRAIGFEAQLERIIRINALPSGLLFSTQLSHIWNSRLQNEYRIALRLSYNFTGLTRSSLQ